MLSEDEQEAIEQLKSWREYIIKHKEKVNKANDIEFYLRIVLNLVKKQQEQLELIKEYAYQEIVHYTEDIRDYIDDDKEGNKHIIGELKEEREHWKDIEKILQNKPKEELYMNWWRYGLYE